MSRAGGFTLLEVLVAMAIFAIIGLGANQMLRTIIQTHDKTKEQVSGLSVLTRAFAVLQRDMAQVVPRGVRDEYGEPMPPLMLGTGPYYLEMTRTGWSNPIGLPRSHLQRVAYEMNDQGELLRHFWLVLDRAEDSEPQTQVILTDIEDFRVRMLNDNAEFTESWPDIDQSVVLPLAVEVVLETENFGALRQVFDLVDTARPLSGQNGESGDAGDAGDEDNPGDDGTDGEPESEINIEPVSDNQ